MNAARKLRERARLQRQGRLYRQAYRPVWDRIRKSIPVVFSLEGRFHSYRIVGDAETVLQRLRDAGAILALESAARQGWGCRLINTDDIFAYVDSEKALQNLHGLAEPDSSLGLHPNLPHCPPCLFVVVCNPLPEYSIGQSGLRIVKPERLLMEYVGFLGHRFDLLAALCAWLDCAEGTPPEVPPLH